MHNHCNSIVLTYNYSQLQLDDSVAGRQYHSMSALHIEPRCVWLLVFGGYPDIADTTIIELSEYSYTYVMYQGVSNCIYVQCSQNLV